jgi:hypothetical protein
MPDYRAPAEKYAQVYLQTMRFLDGLGPAWLPLYPTALSRSGNVVTITYHVPFGTMLFDPMTGPHQSGRWSAFWANGKGFEAYQLLGNVTSASGTPIVIGLDAPHGLSNGATVAVSGVDNSTTGSPVGGNTNANGVFTVTVVDSTHLQLNGTTSNGTFAAPGNACVPIGITSAVVQGNKVLLTLATTPTGTIDIGYADQSDAAYNVQAATAQFSGRFGCLRDSDPYRGPTGLANYNWAVAGVWSV